MVTVFTSHGSIAFMTDLAEEVYVDSFCSYILEISLRIVLEIVGHGHPDGLLAPLKEVLQDEAGNGTTFANTSTVTCK